MTTTKVFWSGRSQAVRLPKEFRLDADRVRIRKKDGCIVLEPVEKDWSWLDDLVGQMDEDALQAAEEHSEEQERPELDELFK